MFQTNDYITKTLMLIVGIFLLISSLLLIFNNQFFFEKYPIISKKISINTELVTNNSFQNMDGWNYIENNLYDGKGVISSISNPVSSLVESIDEKRLYKYSLVAKCSKSADKGKGRLQLIWLSNDSSILESEIKLFDCTAQEKNHSMITHSPADAKYVIVFASGHSEDKIIFKSVSLIKVHPNENLLKLLGLFNFIISLGIFYMAFKGLDRGFYIFSIPFIFLHIIWIIILLLNYFTLSHQMSAEDKAAKMIELATKQTDLYDAAQLAVENEEYQWAMELTDSLIALNNEDQKAKDIKAYAADKFALTQTASNDYIFRSFSVLAIWIILLGALIITRIRSGMSYSFKGLEKAFGLDDIISKNLLILSIILLILGLLNYIFDPGGFIKRTPYVLNDHFTELSALYLKMILFIFLITLIFQYRIGLSSTLLVMSTALSTILFIELTTQLAFTLTFENLYIKLLVFSYFFINLLVFLRNRKLLL
tara:strand:+ start:10383 stop:11825 length:1443 start_codon:yes stop_codon:yes gene_type:complete